MRCLQEDIRNALKQQSEIIFSGQLRRDKCQVLVHIETESTL